MTDSVSALRREGNPVSYATAR